MFNRRLRLVENLSFSLQLAVAVAVEVIQKKRFWMPLEKRVIGLSFVAIQTADDKIDILYPPTITR